MPVQASDPLDTFVEARTADVVGDQARAARLFAALAEGSPQDRELSRRAVTTALEAGNSDLALTVARRMAPAALGLDGRLLIVADLLRAGKANEALAIVNEGTADRDGGFLAPLLRGWAEQKANLDGAKRLVGLPADSLLSPFAPEQRAAMMLAGRRVDEAMPLIAEALSDAGGRETRLRLGFAAALAKAGAKDKARTLLTAKDPALKLIDLDRPQRGLAIDSPAAGLSELLIAVAISLSRDDDRSLPLGLAQIARHASPDNSDAHLLTALFLERQGHERDALAVLARIPADDPFAEDALDTSSRLLLAEKRGPEALTLAQRSVERRDATAADYARLGNVLDELGRPEESAAAFARGAALADAAGASDRWTYRLLGAAQLDKLKRWDASQALLREGLAIAPDEPLLLNYLGYNSIERGEDLDAAEAMIRRALVLRPDDASITDSLGWALFKRGRVDEAISTLRRASAADPAQYEIEEHLGDALYTAGRRYEARFAWRAALVTVDDGPEKRRIEAKIATGLSQATAAP